MLYCLTKLKCSPRLTQRLKKEAPPRPEKSVQISNPLMRLRRGVLCLYKENHATHGETLYI